jgi:uncharacterized protein
MLRPMPRIGVISDTHNLLRPEAVEYLRGSDHIIHAGDICDPSVLDELRRIAPVTAVRGNNDRGPWAERIPNSELVRIEGVYFYVVHDIGEMDIDPVAAGVQVVVSGHSHQPAIFERDSVLFLNPGSAGPRRFKLPVSAGEVLISEGHAVANTALLLPSAD